MCINLSFIAYLVKCVHEIKRAYNTLNFAGGIRLKYEAILAKVPNVEPEPFDRFPIV